MPPVVAREPSWALISFQNENGEPEMVEKVTILPPQSKMGVIDDITRNKIINSSTLAGKYDEAVERDSAYEELDKMTIGSNALKDFKDIITED